MKWSLALVALAACSDAGTSQPTAVARSVDDHGAPRIVEVRGAPIATPVEHVQRLASSWHVSPAALPALDEVGTLRVDGGTITRVRQTIDGLPVWGGELRVLVRASGQLQTITGTLVGRDRPRSRRFIDGKDAAISRAAAGAHVDRALARQVWYPSGDALIAAWVVDAYTSAPVSITSDATRTILAGDDGRVLQRYSLVADAFDYKVYAETSGELHPLDGPQVDATPHPTGVPDGSYPAYLAGPSTIHVDGLNSLGDPWLDPAATETAGNNVDAYVDLGAPNGLSDGDFRASVTTAATFGHVYDTSLGPLANQDQQMASITSLFYVINWLHDFWYDAGFTEAAGNAQAMNYGRGGVEGDVILAEAQDNALGGSRNNANMATPDDGMSPRMQVFVWSGKDHRTMTLSPSGRTPSIGVATFGPKNFDLSGTLIVGTDGAGANPTDGCEALPAEGSGKIVVVDRGNCTFKRKTLNAQNAGAIGLIIVNNVAGTIPPPMGEDSTITTTITIPPVSVTDTEGAAVKADIAAGAVTATIHRDVGVDLDGALDSTLIAHELGHYIHHRLTLCGNAICRALSEGWGDFSALLLLARPGDNLQAAFPFSVYVTQGYSQDPGYYGIRRAPYSANMAINSLSYRHMADGEPLPTTHPFMVTGPNSEVHNAGEIWASALWQGYVALQAAGSSFTDVRAKMARYVVAGLALTPTEASPMEAR
ncbi:MAG TPA: M36 family metallopeptidase, partial [Kofleriaceae bacterium]|nr:M36 family metallopeptidase [Kofleriaceae bacterium]